MYDQCRPTERLQAKFRSTRCGGPDDGNTNVFPENSVNIRVTKKVNGFEKIIVK
jgi:hypothetical protein